MRRKRTVVIGGCIAALLLSACGEAATKTNRAPTVEVVAPALVLDWQDLMPEGEEERLNDIYTEFYREFERNMMSKQMSLSDYANRSIDNIEEGSDLDTMPQLGTFNTVPELDSRRVKLPGFVVPLDFQRSGKVKDFLFVPYFGACLHTPPPPPNQIVYVEGEVSLSPDDLWLPYWAVGVMRTRSVENDLGDAAYTLELSSLEPYEG